MHAEEKIKGIEFWNEHAPVVQSITARMTLKLHQISGWECMHLDLPLTFAQDPADIDTCLKTPA